ncbi:cation:proton antiporter [Nitratireductor sp. ZSWI3]|uniref:cation:proton antiporter domain-containing protein n=1 Tax=Nitratireductor sp. ZSWI3 TaxID=2966359 RepID=UPI00214F8976|nr:cation:proton antiporter [Nitratireductor sp. ZSWI3]MCR4266397.1 cation:proton antiporter [Nitratireductor sp. ZSWI3]
MDLHAALVLLFFCFTLYSLVARWLETSVLSGPILFTGVGYVFFSLDAALISPLDNSVVEFLATATLAIILFRDAANIRISNVMAERATALLSARLLFLGIPLTIVAGTLAGLALFPALGFFGALVLAIVLTPTDAALAQPVFGNDGLPEVEREALDVESGLNDGLCLPLLLIALALAAETRGGDGMTGHAAFFLKQVVFGPLGGLAVGYAGAVAARYTSARGLSNPAGRTPIMVALAGLAYLAAEQLGGNGFLAAFSAGLAFGWHLPADTVEKASNFAKTEGSILTNLTFLIFGAVMLPRALGSDIGPAVVYAALSLTVVRMVPVFLAMLGTGTTVKARLFAGWFGPRGLASVLYLILVVDQSGFTAAEPVTDIAVFTILLSVILHGVSAPFAQRMFFPARA